MDHLMGNKKCPGRRSDRGCVKDPEIRHEDGTIIAGFRRCVKEEV